MLPCYPVVLTQHIFCTMKLPRSVQEIADVIGRERTLFLIGKLPRCFYRDSRYPAAQREEVVLYVPKSLKPDHPLVAILGWGDAQLMVRAFGGELLKPTNCRDVYRPFRDEAMRALQVQGVPISVISEWFGMTERRVRQVLEIPQEAPAVAANDNRANHSAGRQGQHEPRTRGTDRRSSGKNR